MRKRAPRTTITHQLIMMDYLEKNVEMVTSKFKTPQAKAMNKKKWEELTNKLNLVGTGNKHAIQWQRILNDWISKTKNKAAKLKYENRKTDGEFPEIRPLSALEKRLMALKGWNDVHGNENIPEAGFRDESQVEIVETPEYEINEQSLVCTSAADNSSRLPVHDTTDHIQEETSNIFQKPSAPKTKRKKTDREGEKESSRIQKTSESLQQPTEREDATIAFSKYLAKKLNQFDPRTKSILIHKINVLIFEAEMNTYSRNSETLPYSTSGPSSSSIFISTSQPASDILNLSPCILEDTKSEIDL